MLIGLTGRSASGKGEVAKYLEQKSFYYYSLSDVIRDEIRRRGILVALVTGRRLDDLRRVTADLTCFDVLVAENGAVLEFPASGQHVRLAHPPPAGFLEALRQRGVLFDVGEAIVEADASAAPAILEIIRAQQLPLTLAFNRGRSMVLPPAIAKSTGLRQALHTLRISPHNTIGIGDAENDHDLLDVCETGAAVEWGSPALCAIADDIIRGTPVSAVADYLRRVSQQPRLWAAQMGRRRLHLGSEHDGTPLSLAVRGRTIIVAGEPGTGKSWLAGLICEQSILQGYAVCVVDPEGDYLRRYIPELRSLPGKAAHEPWDHPLLAVGYPERIVDHSAERDESLRRYAVMNATAER